MEHLLKQVRASSIIASPSLVGKLKPVTQALPEIRLSVAKSFIDYLEGPAIGKDLKVSNPDHFCDDFDRNVLILHSSGTTGLPKAIPQPHKYLLGYSTCHIRTEAEDIRGLNMSTLPLYHVRTNTLEASTIHLLYPGFWHAGSYALSQCWEAFLPASDADYPNRQFHHFGTAGNS